MAYIEVIGGKHLHGELSIHGSKNAVLPILAASVMHKGISRINNCPRIRDVFSLIRLIESIGCSVVWEGKSIIVDATKLTSNVVSEEYVRTMRSSIILLGALLGREKSVTISYPGGCAIGKRPIDLHIKAMKQLQVDIQEKDETITCSASKLIGAPIEFEFPSVGATQNAILASIFAEGETIISNAAKEPEIMELCLFLKAMGADISGAGTRQILVRGVSELHDVEYDLSADRIVMGTYLTAVAGTGGDLTLRGHCCMENLSLIHVLRKMGCRIGMGNDYINICSYDRPKAVKMLQTEPYPGFPTDMQSQIMSVLTVANGDSLIIENIFESRYKNVPELRKMGADIFNNGKVALVHGIDTLTGATVNAYDLRGGAALVIAGLMAQGRTQIMDIHYIERGYEDICNDLSILGADIRLIQV